MAYDAQDNELFPGTAGGIAATHPVSPAPDVLVAPSTNGNYNTLRRGLTPVACWRVDDVRFAFDSSFLRPEVADEIVHLRTLRELNKQQVQDAQSGSLQDVYPPLSIFGHADPTGSDDYNKRLSGRRAISLYALLVRRTDLWEKLRQDPDETGKWGDDVNETMLSRLGYTGSDAVSRFQQSQSITADGQVGPETRDKLYRAYMDSLAGSDFVLDSTSDFLARGADSAGLKADVQGCSEFNPVLIFSQAEEDQFGAASDKSSRNAANSRNRRVTALLFRPGTRVDYAQWPCPRTSEGTSGCRARFWSDGENRRSKHLPDAPRDYAKTADTFACRFYDRLSYNSPCEGGTDVAPFRIRLCDHDKNPIPGAPCRFTQGNSTIPHKADSNGFVTVFAKQTPESLRVEWTRPQGQSAEHGSTPQQYPFSLEVFVVTGEGDEGAFRRLHNVGYGMFTTLEDRVKAFQRDFGRPETGVVADISSDLIKWHDGGAVPTRS